MGLYGSHAYTLTGAASVPCADNKKVPLLRVRNPWGTVQGEWRGPWADGAPQWYHVDPGVIEELGVIFQDDGEFWMELDDFIEHFEDVHICSATPDFDQDGKEDGLGKADNSLGSEM